MSDFTNFTQKPLSEQALQALYGRGLAMLKSMGYKIGEGLRPDSIATPLAQIQRPKRLGIGAEREDETDALNAPVSEELLKEIALQLHRDMDAVGEIIDSDELLEKLRLMTALSPLDVEDFEKPCTTPVNSMEAQDAISALFRRQQWPVDGWQQARALKWSRFHTMGYGEFVKMQCKTARFVGAPGGFWTVIPIGPIPLGMQHAYKQWATPSKKGRSKRLSKKWRSVYKAVCNMVTNKSARKQLTPKVESDVDDDTVDESMSEEDPSWVKLDPIDPGALFIIDSDFE
eukprot:GEMP01039215.1.p1 GENE.GEMP01039215.1~~GEMP01039215.1.p1  ORF type:complete len:287 (-),score=70.41 GEMP01039215.1:954-1814(-)